MDNAKQKLKNEVEGFSQEKSFKQILDLLRGLVVEGAFAEREMASMVAGFDMAGDFCGAKGDWLKSGHSTWFVHGNISNEDANMLVNTGNNILGLKQKPFEKL
jgi:secreted Zn-dependent insulinase-like peptidase